MTFLKDLKFEIKDVMLIVGILGLFYKYDNKQNERYYDLKMMIERLSNDYYIQKDNNFKLSLLELERIDSVNWRNYLSQEFILPSAPRVPERIEQTS